MFYYSNMKKILLILLVICTVWVYYKTAYASTTVPQSGIIKRLSISSVLKDYGFDLNRNLYLLLEKNKLQDGRLSSYNLTYIAKWLRRFDKTRLVHKQCKTWVYAPLHTDFYSEIGMVIPYYNTIQSYKILWSGATWSKEYTVGTGDMDRKDNCWGLFEWKDDKPAQCARRVWSYFEDHSFEITKCK